MAVRGCVAVRLLVICCKLGDLVVGSSGDLDSQSCFCSPVLGNRGPPMSGLAKRKNGMLNLDLFDTDWPPRRIEDEAQRINVNIPLMAEC